MSMVSLSFIVIFSTFSTLVSTQDLVVNVVYNKLSQHALNLTDKQIISIEPRGKVWFAIDNGILFALPLFGDYSGPFFVHLRSSSSSMFKLQFDLAPSSSLFSPSNHLLLGLFNFSSISYRNTSYNRVLLVRTLSLALNLSDSLLTIHRINGSMIKVYFSCDFFHSNNLREQIQRLIEFYYSNRLALLSRFPLPLIEISIVRLTKSILSTSANLNLKTAVVTRRPLVSLNRTILTANMSNPLLYLNQFYQPLVLVPLFIILIGLCLCSLIAFCLCCNRRSSSSSTLLLPSGPSGYANNKHLYENYSYRKHRQQQEHYKKKRHSKDQRQFISKGIPVIFAEELEEKLEQTHTPLVMRIERTPFYQE